MNRNRREVAFHLVVGSKLPKTRPSNNCHGKDVSPNYGGHGRDRARTSSLSNAIALCTDFTKMTTFRYAADLSDLCSAHGTQHISTRKWGLVELQSVQQVVEFSVLLLLRELDLYTKKILANTTQLGRYVPMKAGHVVLQQSMQRELGFLVHANLVGVGHKPWDTTRCRIGQGILTHQAFDLKRFSCRGDIFPLN